MFVGCELQLAMISSYLSSHSDDAIGPGWYFVVSHRWHYRK
jgi:hypothetical protein